MIFMNYSNYPCRCPITSSKPCNMTSDLTHLGVSSLQCDLWLWCVCHFQAPVKLIALMGHSSSCVHRTAGDKMLPVLTFQGKWKSDKFSLFLNINMFSKTDCGRCMVSAYAAKIQRIFIQNAKWSRINEVLWGFKPLFFQHKQTVAVNSYSWTKSRLLSILA